MFFQNSKLWAGGSGASRARGQVRKPQLQAPPQSLGSGGRRRRGPSSLPLSHRFPAEPGGLPRPGGPPRLLNTLQGGQVEQEGGSRETETDRQTSHPITQPFPPSFLPLHPQCPHHPDGLATAFSPRVHCGETWVAWSFSPNTSTRPHPGLHPSLPCAPGKASSFQGQRGGTSSSRKPPPLQELLPTSSASSSGIFTHPTPPPHPNLK